MDNYKKAWTFSVIQQFFHIFLFLKCFFSGQFHIYLQCILIVLMPITLYYFLPTPEHLLPEIPFCILTEENECCSRCAA